MDKLGLIMILNKNNQCFIQTQINLQLNNKSMKGFMNCNFLCLHGSHDECNNTA